MNQAPLPRFDAVLDLYRVAHDQHGTDPFTATDLDWGSSKATTDYIFDLAVAYGLLSFDGSAYQVTCPPDASEQCWGSVAEERIRRVQREIPDALDPTDARSDSAGHPEALTYEGDEYASVSVAKSDNFAAVAEAVSTVSLEEWAGIVLRSPGNYANEVQRFADRLGDPSELANISLSTPFQKEYSDVIGTSKDELEFRLFLSRP